MTPIKKILKKNEKNITILYVKQIFSSLFIVNIIHYILGLGRTTIFFRIINIFLTTYLFKFYILLL